MTLDPITNPRKRVRVHPPTGGRSLTKQSMRDECNVNLIVAAHAKTGVVAHMNRGAPQFGDFSGHSDLKAAIDGVAQATETFMLLPAEVRALANNSPVDFLEMLADEGGALALQEAGLALGIAVPEPIVPAVVVPNNSPAPGEPEKTGTTGKV